MKAALDVYYSEDRSRAACVVFESWSDAHPIATCFVDLHGVLPYRSGLFFERELGPLLAVLEEAGERFSHIIIDGYVHLKDKKMGLGAHLHDALPYRAIIVGVAKNPLALAHRFVTVHRGRSAKPLFISAAGWELNVAAAAIAGMHGLFRIPTLLRAADRIAREV